MVEYNETRPLRVMTLASGYDSQAMAFERLKSVFPQFDYELVAWAEYDPETPNVPIDKQPAVVAHKALFKDSADKNWGDITQIDWTQVPDMDFLFGSTPCQSISAAGLQHGFAKGSGTRSSIIWNVHDCVRIKKPRWIVMENVAAILSAKFYPTLKVWLKELENMGYVNYMPPSFPTPWNMSSTKEGCLNSKNYGVTQNRERWFCVSILKTEDDPNPYYEFPAPIPLTTCLSDVLEDDVDESYFLSDEMLSRFCTKSMEEDVNKDSSDAMQSTLFDDEEWED